MFGPVSPGCLVMSHFEVAKEVEVCMLFKISHEVFQCGAGDKVRNMVLLSFMEDENPNSGLDVEICVDTRQDKFYVRDGSGQQVQFRLENRWHMMVLRLQRVKGLINYENQVNCELFIDSFEPQRRFAYPQMKVGVKQRFYLALGNTVARFTHERPSKFFWGKCSLPLFCQGLPDTKQLKEMD